MWDVDRVHARLAAMAEADPRCEVFGASQHRYQLGAPLSDADLTGFEQQHAITLPEHYRHFLVHVGDGGAGPYYGLYRLDGSDMYHLDQEERFIPGHLATSFPHQTAWNPNEGDPATFMSDDKYFDPRWSAGSMIIAHYGCGKFFRLIVTGHARGQVWFDSRASDGGLEPGPDFHDWYLSWLDAWPS